MIKNYEALLGVDHDNLGAFSTLLERGLK